ncbi:MAG: flagellar basal body protein [Alphaproteobacteria bacterium]|nr:flagellar basal body protein [Alphaproteobacteria bacterium]MBU1513995.1 flagellar basal body protein [Alphaproteobacteria bacterium]MBU2093065.1 flagellar basal body protein [Alphaproteobacteria bacterium]MBU2151732.1 flagellar basal body protein [Alphaproteobacteria bacterium]MBU2309448.1 flagellar basal body protein [Alphaproteobacteria bacterium]
MAIAATDATDRVEQLVILTERLTELIANQAQAFEQRRPQDAASMLEETSRLANLYRHESARVRADPRMVESAPLEARTRLVRATEAFDSVLARQGRAIEAARTVTEGLVKCIAEEVASQRTKASSYGATGLQTAGATATAITLNKRA